MTFKKSLLALSLLASTSSLYAADSSEKHFRSGFYLGAMEGLSAGQAKMSESYRPDARDVLAGTAASFDATKSISRASFVSEIIVGGRHLFENGFFPGFEVAASFANHKFENDFTFNDAAFNLVPGVANGDFTFKAATKRRYSIVPSVVLGWTMSQQFNLFAKLGLGITKYDTRILNDTVDGITNAGFNRGSTSKTYYSFVPALGLEYSFSRHVSFVASVSYEVGSKPEFTNSRLFLTNPLPMVDSNKVSTRVSIFTQKIGLLVKF